jgi:ABC-type antimicrobial peptide transport system permease subunit
MISTFVLSCFSLLYATEKVALNMRTSVSAAFHIRPIDISTQGEKNVISEKSVQQIMSTKNLKYYNGRNSGYAKNINFIPGAYHTYENNMGQISANNYSALHPNFQDKIFELTEGRHITTSDKNVLIISETLANFNGLSVGDVVTLSPAKLAQENGKFVDSLLENKTKVSAKIIGIFKELAPQADSAYQPTAGLRLNMLFSDHSFLTELGIANEGEYADGVSFYMVDPLYLDDVVNEVKQMNSIDWNSFFVHKDDFGYEKISAGLQTIQNLIKILLVCVSVVSTAVMILILTMRMRGRTNEAGILMSVGIPKRAILGQFIAEVAIVSVVAFVCSFFVSSFVSGKITNKIIDVLQVKNINEQVLQTGFINNLESTLFTMPVQTTMLIYACLTAVILISVLLSSLAIIKLKPREIFSKMS